MFSLFIDHEVAYDIIEAVAAYRSYFMKHGEPEKGEAWADRFLEDYLAFLASLQEDPYAYAPCRAYPFDGKRTNYHCCAIGWFTALFTIEDNEVCLRHVVNSKSDFGKLRTRRAAARRFARFATIAKQRPCEISQGRRTCGG